MIVLYTATLAVDPDLKYWGRPGFDVGYKAAQGIPRPSYLVNTTGIAIVANDDSYALAA